MAPYNPTGIKKTYHNARRALAAWWLGNLHPIQIGITGSQGKTGTTEIVTRVLSQLGNTLRTDVNLDTTFNVPITALRARPWTKYIVWELGIDHPGEMDRHHEIAHPTISAVTGISPVHTDAEHMGSLERLIEEKRRIIEHLPQGGFAILNHDNEYVRTMATHTKANVLWYGRDPSCQISVDPDSITLSLEGTSAQLSVQSSGTNHRKDLMIQTPLIGVHHVSNIMCAYLIIQAACPEKHIDEIFIETLTLIKPLPGRMSCDPGPMQTTILNDSLRANPESTISGLETFSRIPCEHGKKIAVIGEMGELADPIEEHRNTGLALKDKHIDLFVCIGPLRKHTISAAREAGVPDEKLRYANDVFEAADILKTILKPGDIWYLKGSLLRNYRRIIKILNNEQVCCREVLCPYEHCQ